MPDFEVRVGQETLKRVKGQIVTLEVHPPVDEDRAKQIVRVTKTATYYPVFDKLLSKIISTGFTVYYKDPQSDENLLALGREAADQLCDLGEVIVSQEITDTARQPKLFNEVVSYMSY